MKDPQAIAATLRSAQEAVDAASLPDELRVPAFEWALSALLPAGPGSSARDLGRPRLDPEVGREISSETSKAAMKLRVDEGLLGRVLDFDEEGVHILVPRSKLAKPKSEAIQQVATLIVAGRQAAGYDEDGWTHQALVRHATEVLGVDDASNFSTHMKRLNGVRSKGSGKTGELKMNAVGFEAAGELIRRLAADTD